MIKKVIVYLHLQNQIINRSSCYFCRGKLFKVFIEYSRRVQPVTNTCINKTKINHAFYLIFDKSSNSAHLLLQITEYLIVSHCLSIKRIHQSGLAHNRLNLVLLPVTMTRSDTPSSSSPLIGCCLGCPNNLKC